MNDRQKTSLREHFQSKAKQFLLQTKEQAFEYSIRPDNGYIIKKEQANENQR